MFDNIIPRYRFDQYEVRRLKTWRQLQHLKPGSVFLGEDEEAAMDWHMPLILIGCSMRKDTVGREYLVIKYFRQGLSSRIDQLIIFNFEFPSARANGIMAYKHIAELTNGLCTSPIRPKL